jgi:hypothetical protein
VPKGESSSIKASLTARVANQYRGLVYVFGPETPMGIMEKRKRKFVINRIWVGEHECGVLISRI